MKEADQPVFPPNFSQNDALIRLVDVSFLQKQRTAWKVCPKQNSFKVWGRPHESAGKPGKPGTFVASKHKGGGGTSLHNAEII